MIPTVYERAGDAPRDANARAISKGFHLGGKTFIARDVRPGANHRRDERGFTLTELMIVLAVITIVAVIAFPGIRGNQFEGAYLRFTDDLVGTMTQARNRAIDDQTVVRVQVEVDRLEVYWIDPEDPPPDVTAFNTGTFLWGNYRDKVDGGLIRDDACITGLVAGIRPPSEINNTALPQGCGSNLPSSILFQPDGSFHLADNSETDAGMTLVIKDDSSDLVYYSIIEIFPGGLVRKIDEMPAP